MNCAPLRLCIFELLFLCVLAHFASMRLCAYAPLSIDALLPLHALVH
jgi:hypothetical protein